MAVTACEFTSRCALADGRDFGAVGPYEQVDGTAQFAVDPTSPLNQGITDLHLAPRDDNGLVCFAADVRILTPVDVQRGNHRLLLDVPNRGNRLALTMFNHAPRPAPSAPLDPGNGFLMRQGYTIVWCGWQHDVPNADGLMRIQVPEAQNAGGPISGKILVKFQPNAPSQVHPPPSRFPCLADGTAVPPEHTADIFTAIPGVQFPTYLPSVVRLDFGPEAEAGVATILPPKVGQGDPTLRTDAEQARGIR